VDQGRELFERLKAQGWALIEEWRAAEEPETQFLEFKRKANPSIATVGPEDRDNIAKAVSSFANGDGGLLVIGVAAGGGNREGFDRVTGVVLINDAEKFGGAVEVLVRTSTEPPIPGLMVWPIEKPDAAPMGVVAVYVPPSLARPHRATSTGRVNNHYYMRTAAGAHVIPHSMLTALFAYSSPPRLELWARCSGITPNARPSIELRLRNTGRSPARAPAVWLFDFPSHLGLTVKIMTPPGFAMRRGSTEDGRSYVAIEAAGDLVIYPGTDRVLSDAPCEDTAMRTGGDVVVQLHARIMSLDTPPVEGTTQLKFHVSDEAVHAKQHRAAIRGDDMPPSGGT